MSGATRRDTGRAMSQGKVEFVRKPLRVRQRSRRSLDERLALRFPRPFAAYARLIGRLPPSSRLRQASLWRGVQRGLEAYNRRDLDAVVIGCHPQFEWHPDPRWVEAGLMESSYRGAEGYRRYVAATAEVFGGEVYVKPVELIDLGARFVVLAEAPMRAQASGVPLTEAWALVATLEDGQVISYHEHFDHAEALAAVGLSG
jgi:ketosteroid isomerase-like protein